MKLLILNHLLGCHSHLSRKDGRAAVIQIAMADYEDYIMISSRDNGGPGAPMRLLYYF